jgi:hypothetical protein
LRTESNNTLINNKYRCPHCGAGIRFGVWFSPKKLEIIDKITRGGNEGLSAEQLGISLDTLKSHVHQINVLLLETDYRIRGRCPGYRIVHT